MFSTTRPLIELRQITKVYRSSLRTVTALADVTLHVQQGEFVAVMGKSGSGKTTLLHLIAGLERPTQGAITVQGTPLHTLDENQRTIWRGRHVGIVFQFFQLLPTLTLLENVMFPMEVGVFAPWSVRQARAEQLLAQVELTEWADAFPSELSGGQQQRAAIARALANEPPLLLADEPTGNLDSATAESIFHLFDHFVQQGRTLILVTHDPEFAGRAHRVIHLVDGQIVHNE